VELNVFLLSSKDHPEMATFFSHLGHEFIYCKTIDELSSLVLSSRVDLLFLDEKFLQDPLNETPIQRVLGRVPNARLFILSANLRSFKWPHSGVFSFDDYQGFKSVCEQLVAHKDMFKSKTQANFTPGANDSDEIVIDVEEEEEEVMETELTRGLVRIKSCESIDQLSSVLCDTLEKVLKEKRRGVFFKYLPTYCSLVAMGSFFFENPKKLNGVGLNFSKSTKFKPNEHLQYGLKVPAFTKLCEKLFGHKRLNIRVLSVDQEVQGLLVYEKPPSNSLDLELEMLVDLSNTKLESIKYKTLYSKNRVKDEKTSLFLKEPFFQYLQNEVIRAKRLFLPVTLFLIEVDNFRAIKANYNQERVNLLIKNISTLLNSFVRHNDTVGRLSENRFGIIFPHMHKMHADSKAQSILVKIKETQFFSDMKEKFHCTCSISTGTYPNHAMSSEELITLLQNSLDKKDQDAQILELPLIDESRKDFSELSLPELSQYASSNSRNGPQV
jgi:diguanylate cyclase (GGDEF)-like protein